WGLSASRGSSLEGPALLRAALRAALRDGLQCRPANVRQCGSSTSATSPAGAPRLLGPFSARRGQRFVTGTAYCFALRAPQNELTRTSRPRERSESHRRGRPGTARRREAHSGGG